MQNAGRQDLRVALRSVYAFMRRLETAIRGPEALLYLRAPNSVSAGFELESTPARYRLQAEAGKLRTCHVTDTRLGESTEPFHEKE